MASDNGLRIDVDRRAAFERLLGNVDPPGARSPQKVDLRIVDPLFPKELYELGKYVVRAVILHREQDLRKDVMRSCTTQLVDSAGKILKVCGYRRELVVGHAVK